MYADDQFVHHPVGSGVDLQQPVLVRPAVHVDVLPVLYHLLGRSRSGCHAGTLDVARDLVPPGVDDENAVVPELGHIGLFVGDEVDVPRRGEVRDAAHLLECTEVDCEDDMRIVHDDPSQIVVDGHRLCHVAQLHGVGTVENLVLDLFRCRVVIGERGVAVLEISLVGDEQPRPRRGELFHVCVVPLHAAAQCRQAQDHGQDMS